MPRPQRVAGPHSIYLLSCSPKLLFPWETLLSSPRLAPWGEVARQGRRGGFGNIPEFPEGEEVLGIIPLPQWQWVQRHAGVRGYNVTLPRIMLAASHWRIVHTTIPLRCIRK